jgi:hypothetical protein
MDLCKNDIKNGSAKGQISLYEGVIVPVRKLTLSSEMGNLEIFEHLEKMDRYLQDEDSVLKLLYFLPVCRGSLSILAEGLFSSNSEIK